MELPMESMSLEGQCVISMPLEATTPIHLKGLGGWNRSLLEADRCCGSQWNFQWILPQRVDWKANTTVATGAAAAGVQYTWRSSTVESIDRSTTVGLEDGSVSASNGGKPNRLEVVSFTFKGLLPMESRPLP